MGPSIVALGSLGHYVVQWADVNNYEPQPLLEERARRQYTRRGKTMYMYYLIRRIAAADYDDDDDVRARGRSSLCGRRSVGHSVVISAMFSFRTLGDGKVFCVEFGEGVAVSTSKIGFLMGLIKGLGLIAN